MIVGSSLILMGITAVAAFHTQGLNRAILYALCLGLGILSSAIAVIGFTTTKEMFPLQIAGTSTGLVNLFPFAGGAVFQPLIGYVLGRHVQTDGTFALAGYRDAFQIFFLCAILAFLSSLFFKETLYPGASFDEIFVKEPDAIFEPSSF